MVSFQVPKSAMRITFSVVWGPNIVNSVVRNHREMWYIEVPARELMQAFPNYCHAYRVGVYCCAITRLFEACLCLV